ncbi:MAG TPA: hypothetical protein DDZ91_03300 [Firmicutes bacterium]|jgi:LacI family transcriptional regulator|nr:hypothetical protein [Bacillota bacterium]
MSSIILKDIAKVIGVSEATVSRALRNKPGVNPELREKIFKLAQELNYPFKLPTKEPNYKRIGIIVPDLSNPFFATIIYGIKSVLSSTGYLLYIINTDEDSEAEEINLQSLINDRVEGIITAPTVNSVNLYEQLNCSLPIVFFDRIFKIEGTSSVAVDNRDAIFQAVRKLVDLGHKKICLIAGDVRIYTGAEREKGFQESLRLLDLKAEECPVVYGNFKEPESYAVTKEVLQKRQCTAIIATSNKTTLGILRAVKELGLIIPDDISVVGFDDQEWMQFFTPQITTIVQPAFTIGSIAANLLLQNIKGKMRDENIFLKTQLLYRESITVPKRG